MGQHGTSANEYGLVEQHSSLLCLSDTSGFDECGTTPDLGKVHSVALATTEHPDSLRLGGSFESKTCDVLPHGHLAWRPQDLSVRRVCDGVGSS